MRKLEFRYLADDNTTHNSSHLAAQHNDGRTPLPYKEARELLREDFCFTNQYRHAPLFGGHEYFLSGDKKHLFELTSRGYFLIAVKRGKKVQQ